MFHFDLEHVHDWTYLTEGNAHVILNYVGTEPALMGYILRLTKKPRQVPLDFQAGFSQHVITPLLGPGYVDPLISTQVTLDFIKSMDEKIHTDRPLQRRKDPLHPSSHGFLAKNWALCYAPQDTWTFEIKPKWGFLPNSPYIHQAHQPLKRKMCRFCMHQRLRQNETPYCPLDLYSGDPQRIRKALTTTFTQPHGYLKLFHNGRLIPSTHWASTLPSLFTQADWMTGVVDLLTNILLNDPILPTLKQCQRALDEYDVEGIHPLYEKHGQQTTHDIAQWKQVVQRFLERQSNEGTSADVSIDEQEELQRLYEYVLSMTLKDCSVMVCLTKDYERCDGDTVTSSLGHCFRYRIKVVDVDLKKWNKIPFWFDLDRRIIQYNLLQQHGWICLD